MISVCPVYRCLFRPSPCLFRLNNLSDLRRRTHTDARWSEQSLPLAPEKTPRKIHFPVASASDRAGLPQAYHKPTTWYASASQHRRSGGNPLSGTAWARSACFWGNGGNGQLQLIFGAAVSLFFGQRSACFLGWVSSFLIVKLY